MARRRAKRSPAVKRDIAPVSEYDAFEFQKLDKPVDVVWPEDGTVLLPAPLALVAGSKNTDNAKALATYMLSKEGQQLIVDTTLTWSARRDVARRRKASRRSISIKTISFDWTRVAAEKGAVLNLYFRGFSGELIPTGGMINQDPYDQEHAERCTFHSRLPVR